MSITPKNQANVVPFPRRRRDPDIAELFALVLEYAARMQHDHADPRMREGCRRLVSNCAPGLVGSKRAP